VDHARLAHTMGVRQVIVAVHKMDAAEPPFGEERFAEVAAAAVELLGRVGFRVGAGGEGSPWRGLPAHIQRGRHGGSDRWAHGRVVQGTHTGGGAVGPWGAQEAAASSSSSGSVQDAHSGVCECV
jgi:hypothetical protein